ADVTLAIVEGLAALPFLAVGAERTPAIGVGLGSVFDAVQAALVDTRAHPVTDLHCLAGRRGRRVRMRQLPRRAGVVRARVVVRRRVVVVVLGEGTSLAIADERDAIARLLSGGREARPVRHEAHRARACVAGAALAGGVVAGAVGSGRALAAAATAGAGARRL